MRYLPQGWPESTLPTTSAHVLPFVSVDVPTELSTPPTIVPDGSAIVGFSFARLSGQLVIPCSTFISSEEIALHPFSLV